MSDLDEIKALLVDIRDQQKRALEQQTEQVGLAREQLERSQRQIEESIGLQREAVAKQRMVTRIAVPGIAACILAILYLVIRYF